MWGWLTGQSAPSDEQGVDTGKKGAPTIAGLKTFSLNSDLELQLAAAELLEEVRKYGEQDTTAENGWSPVSHSTANVTLFERVIPRLEGTGLTFMKCVGDVEGASPADLLAFTLERDMDKRKEFDPDINLLEILREVTPTLHLTRTQFMAPYPVYHREFVDMRTWVEGDERILYGSQSINLSDGPFSADHVKAASMNGIILDAIPGKNATRITFMGYVDPQGWVPHAVIAVFRAKITERIDVLRKMVAQKKK